MTGPVHLGGFDLLAPIGRGGMGEVWRARHRGSEAVVAIKLVRGGPANREALLAEIRAVAGLDHRGIVAVYDYGWVDARAEAESGGRFEAGSPFLVLELALGSIRRPRGWSELRPVVAELLLALAHAHAHDIVHRDLKPENVLVRADGSHALTDFGLASERLGRAPGGGTPGFQAPEQREGRWRDLGPWTDLYALGKVVCALLWRSRDVPPDAPPALRAWLDALLADETTDRPPTAADALRVMPPPELEVAVAPGVFRSALTAWPSDPAGGPAATPAPAPSAGSPRPPSAVPVELPDWRGLTNRRRAPWQLGVGLLELRHVPMVGRVAERDALWDALRRVYLGGPAGAVVLEGPAGVGKTRLASWLARRARELGVARVVSAEPGDSGLQAALARAIGVVGLEPASRVARLRALWGPFAEEERVAALFGGDPLADPRERAELLRAAVSRVAGAVPLIVLVDQLEASSEVLADLLLLGPAARVLAVATGTGGAAGPTADAFGRRATALRLTGLSREEVGEIARSVAPLEPDDAARLADLAAGNPAHALMMARRLARGGTPSFEVEGGERRALVADAVAEALADVGAPARDDLALAALLGPRAQADEWARARAAWRDQEATPPGSGDAAWGPALSEALDGLARRGLVSVLADGLDLPDGEVRRALLSGVTGSRLERMHAVCAAVVEDDERRGLHLLGAGAADQAVPRLTAAGLARWQAGDIGRCILLFDAVEEALRRAPAVPRSYRLQLLLVRQGVAVHRGRRAEAERWLAEAEAWAEGPVERAWIALTLANGCRDRADLERALSALDQVLATDQPVPDIHRVARGVRADVLVRLGDLDDADREAQVAIDLCADRPIEAVAPIMVQVEVDRFRGDQVQATRRLDDLERLIERHGAAGVRGRLWNERGNIALDAGDPHEATRWYSLAIDAHILSGSRDLWVTELNLAHASIRAAHVAGVPRSGATRSTVTALADRFRRHGDEYMVALASLLLACIAGLDGDRDAWNAAMADVPPQLHGRRDPGAEKLAAFCAERAAARGWREEAARAEGIRRHHQRAGGAT